MGWNESSADWLRVAMREYTEGHLRIAVMAAYNAAAEACEGYMRARETFGYFKFEFAISKLREQGTISDRLERRLLDLDRTRNRAAHHPYESPSGHAVWGMIDDAEDLLDALGLPTRDQLGATFEGLCFVSKRIHHERLRLARFESSDLGFTALCPVDADSLFEHDDRLRFVLWPSELLRELSDLAERQDRRSAWTILSHAKRTPKVMSFRWIHDDLGEDSAIPEETVNRMIREDVDCQVLVNTDSLTDWSEDRVHPNMVDRVEYDDDKSWWRGEYTALRSGEKELLVVGFHTWAEPWREWVAMVKEMVRSVECRKRQGRRARLVSDIAGLAVRPGLGAEENLVMGKDEEGVELGSVGNRVLGADFAVRGEAGWKCAGVVERGSSIVRAKIERWALLERVAREVRVYVPLAFAAEVREFRRQIGRRTEVFGFADPVARGGVVVDRISM